MPSLSYNYGVPLDPEIDIDMKKTEFKVIIAGSRDFADYELLRAKCDALLQDRRDESNIIIVSGTARGADRLGERYARERGYRIERYPADWDRDGNSAGPIRNAKMADNAHALIAFWDGRSRGTMNMIDTARKKGLMVRTINFTNMTEHQSPKAQLTEDLRAATKYYGDNFYIHPAWVDLGTGKDKILQILAPRPGVFIDSITMREITSNIFDEQDIKALTFSIRETVAMDLMHRLACEGNRINISAAEGDMYAPVQDMLDKYLPQFRERDAVINEKLATLRKGLVDNPAFMDADHPDEAVVDYKVGHHYDGTYALSAVLAKSGEQQPREYDYEGLITELDQLNTVRQSEDPKVKKLREQTCQYAIEHITRKGLHTGYAWLRDSFNEYYDAMKTPGVRISAESDIAHRELLAQKVAIDCIHALSHEQLQQLDKVLKEIVLENNIRNGLHR